MFCSPYQTGLALTASSNHRMYRQNNPTISACTVDTNLGMDIHTEDEVAVNIMTNQYEFTVRKCNQWVIMEAVGAHVTAVFSCLHTVFD